MKKDDQLLYQQIDDILWYDWDPIGVNDNESIRDEYRGYVGHLFTLKKQGADIIKISQHLYRICMIDMGVGGNEELVMLDCKRIAQKILNL